MEIERKWLIDKFPSMEPIKGCEVLQSYITVDPEVRTRYIIWDDNTRTYSLDFKSNGDLSREEIEVPISFQNYWRITRMLYKKAIHKRGKCYLLSHGLTLECNLVDEGSDTEFMYAEIEFPSEEAALAFVPPDFLGEEVTYDPAYKMKNYWKRTRLNT